MTMWKTLAVGMTALAVVALGGVTLRPVAANEIMAHMEQMITGAKTPADHEDVAASYDKAAQDARQKQAEHLKVKEWYEKNPALNTSGFGFHCQQIALQFQKMVEEYETLATMHRGMATPAT